MTADELTRILEGLVREWENECVEFKAVGDSFSTSDLGRYFSALSNEANLRGYTSAWLVLGVADRTRRVVGTDYRLERNRLQGLKHQVATGTDPSTSFREIHELTTPSGRVVLFEIPAAPRGIPIAWNRHYYAREGESLTGLSIAKLDEIRAQGLADDWSAIAVEGAAIDDLDPDALAKARALFAARHAASIAPEVIRAWSDAEFLDRAKLTRRGEITRATLLLLGRPQSAVLLSPFVAEMSWKLEGPERAYEHFGPPFLLNTSLLFQRIRNIRLSFLPAGQLIPVDVPKYDQRIVLEALHNCIAHQDYARCERILVIERSGELVFQNAGGFFDGAPGDYVAGSRTPVRYRNRFLAEAMVQLRMIDTMGFGIRDVMFRGQADRFLPMPDYDETGPEHVVLRLQGRFLDQNYSRALFAHADLPWPELLALDAVQKGHDVDREVVESLRRKGLVEGRRPRLHVASDVAASTESEVEYLHNRAFDDTYYCDLIVEYLRKFGTAKRAKFNRLLESKLSDMLTPKQKQQKISNLLKRLKNDGKIRVDGYGQAGLWSLVGE
jgi:ATP-dependent DNA helicase RecG